MKYKNSNNEWQTLKVTNYGIEQTPIGSMIYYPAQAIPKGYLVCDGSEILISEYKELFDVIGYIGGDDVLEGYFRLPDMRGAVAAGYFEGFDSTHPLYGAFGDQVGSPLHYLTVEEMPSHSHLVSAGTFADGNVGFNPFTAMVSSTTGGEETMGYSATTAYAGGSQPHSIVQPTKLYHWLIKAKNIVTLGGNTTDFSVEGDLTVNNDLDINGALKLGGGSAFGISLYSNSSGTSSNITLSKSIEKFNYLEIFYTYRNGLFSKRFNINKATSQTIVLDAMIFTSSTDSYNCSQSYTINGTAMTAGHGGNFHRDYSTGAISGSTSQDTNLKITKIVGFELI